MESRFSASLHVLSHWQGCASMAMVCGTSPTHVCAEQHISTTMLMKCTFTLVIVPTG